MLEVNNVNIFYGKVQALWDVSLKIDKAEIVALLGANGAGKTTLLNTISGLLRPAPGSVTFLGNRLDGMAPYAVAGLGIAHVPEGGRSFPDMTILENLEMGAYPRDSWKQRKETLEEVYQIFPKLKERERQLARTLSGGERQMLVMGRALMSRPKLCMFDEMSYGLAPKVVSEVFEIIMSLREAGITILLVEQNVQQTLGIADRAYVMENGRVVLQGDCEEFMHSDYVKKAYLGM